MVSEFCVAEAKEWADIGRIWLEDRALRLIGRHGSFSQSSLNYHRLMLDTFVLWKFGGNETLFQLFKPFIIDYSLHKVVDEFDRTNHGRWSQLRSQ